MIEYIYIIPDAKDDSEAKDMVTIDFNYFIAMSLGVVAFFITEMVRGLN